MTKSSRSGIIFLSEDQKKIKHRDNVAGEQMTNHHE